MSKNTKKRKNNISREKEGIFAPEFKWPNDRNESIYQILFDNITVGNIGNSIDIHNGQEVLDVIDKQYAFLAEIRHSGLDAIKEIKTNTNLKKFFDDDTFNEIIDNNKENILRVALIHESNTLEAINKIDTIPQLKQFFKDEKSQALIQNLKTEYQKDISESMSKSVVNEFKRIARTENTISGKDLRLLCQNVYKQMKEAQKAGLNTNMEDVELQKIAEVYVRGTLRNYNTGREQKSEPTLALNIFDRVRGRIHSKTEKDILKEGAKLFDQNLYKAVKPQDTNNKASAMDSAIEELAHNAAPKSTAAPKSNDPKQSNATSRSKSRAEQLNLH